ncbi:PAS domain S-box protein [Massilia sp. B-10]|nr:PAS domain S-box protein [Massilia sp. B-10]
MRNNQPVTTHQVVLHDERAIVSKTDTQGNITYVNPYFCEVSGFAEDELIGQPQNIVRHPDMPRAAFADLWASLRAETPWTGMVKNRCKNGDYYWVKANVTPIREAGRVAGFMSVRVRPTQQEVQAASEGYARLNGPDGGAWTVQDGEVVRNGWLFRQLRRAWLSLRDRIWLATSIVNVLLVGVCVASLSGKGAGAPIFAATAAGLLINVFLWYTLRHNVVQPLVAALGGARAIAAGDLSAAFSTHSHDEMGQLLRAGPDELQPGRHDPRCAHQHRRDGAGHLGNRG